MIAKASSQTDQDLLDTQVTTSPDASLAGIIMALGSAFVYAASSISNRAISDFPYQLIMLWGGGLAVVIWVSILLF